MPQAIRGYFGDGESLGLNIEYSVEESPLGTAGSVRLASDRLDETFLVISGDALCDVDLTELIDTHKREGRRGHDRAQVGRRTRSSSGSSSPTRTGGSSASWRSPPGARSSRTRSTPASTCSSPRRCATCPTDGPYDFSKELFPLLLEMGRPLYGHVLDGYWQDIGNLDQFRQANFDALDERVQLDIGGIRLRGNIWLGEGVEVDDLDAIEAPAYLGNYCRVAPDASVGAYSVLGSSVTLLRARPDRALGDRRGHAHRPQRPRRGRGRRARLRHPRARARPRGRGDRRRGHPRRAERGAAAACGSTRTRRSRPARRSTRA